MSSSRNLREIYNSYHFSLDEAKDTLKKYTKCNFDLIGKNYFLTYKGTKNIYEKNCYYLHFLIIFKTPLIVENFLIEHKNEFGHYATKMFINFPIINNITNNIITPLKCALNWNTDPEMIRMLYKWGADLSLPDLNGNYVEDNLSKYYVNHLNPYIANNIYILGTKSTIYFSDVINEVYYLLGKKSPPDNWSYPVRII